MNIVVEETLLIFHTIFKIALSLASLEKMIKCCLL